MGLEFSFDDIGLDQQVSGDQLEIDLYDELITITDAESDEQVRLLAAGPQPGRYKKDDQPESIRITSSLAKAPATSASAATGQIVAGQDEALMTPPPPNGAKSQPLLSINPVSPETRPQAAPTAPPAPPPVQCDKPEPVHTAIPATVPSPKTREMMPPPSLVQQSVASPPTIPRPPAPVPPPGIAAPVLAGGSAGAKCQDCGQPAGESDMICIECGAFLG